MLAEVHRPRPLAAQVEQIDASIPISDEGVVTIGAFRQRERFHLRAGKLYVRLRAIGGPDCQVMLPAGSAGSFDRPIERDEWSAGAEIEAVSDRGIFVVEQPPRFGRQENEA